MDIAAYTDVLDLSITAVADREYKRLSYGKQPEEICSKVHRALDSLGEPLRQGTPPNYKDRWVALCYLTWHQPGHIQLGRLLLEEVRRNRKDEWPLSIDQNCLQVYDFGCGSLAMQFAVMWAASDAIEAGKPLRYIEVNSYDSSNCVINLGISLWREFTNRARQDDRLGSLSQVVDLVKVNYGMPGHPIDFVKKRGERILSALHTAYQDNIGTIKPLIASRKEIIEPTLGLLSGHANWLQYDLLEQASPFDTGSYRAHQPSLTSKHNRVLPEITKWRRELNGTLLRQHPFLNRNVSLKFEKAWGWTYSQIK